MTDKITIYRLAAVKWLSCEWFFRELSKEYVSASIIDISVDEIKDEESTHLNMIMDQGKSVCQILVVDAMDKNFENKFSTE